MSRILAISLFVSLLGSSAVAVELYGITDTSLYKVDPETGAADLVGALDPQVPGLLGGLEWANGKLYGLAGTPGNALWVVDPATAECEYVGPIGGSGAIFEGGLAFDGHDMWGVNYGIVNQGKSLIRINLGTGQGTVIGLIGNGDVDFNGLAVWNGGLYGIERITNAMWYINTTNPAASYKFGPGFGVNDLGVKGGLAGEYAYADDSQNYFRVDFEDGTAQKLAGSHDLRFRSLAPMLCPADVNDDGVVDIDDVFQVLSAWGPCENCPEDINNDSTVDIDDLFEVLAAWGPCP